MDWTDDHLTALHNAMAQAKRQGAFISASEAGMVLDMIQAYRRVTMRRGSNGPPEGLPPTIGDSRRHRVTGLFVQCQGSARNPHCRNQRRLSFDDLKLPDEVVFIEIVRRVRFRCTACGGRKVSIMPDWPNPMEERERQVRARDR